MARHDWFSLAMEFGDFKALPRFLDELGLPRFTQALYQGAVGAAARSLAQRARALAPVRIGVLRASIGTRRLRPQLGGQRLGANVVVRRPGSQIHHLAHNPVKPHEIRFRKRLRTSKGGRRGQFTHRFARGGTRRGVIRHPGSPGNPYLLNALRSGAGQAVVAARASATRAFRRLIPLLQTRWAQLRQSQRRRFLP